MGNMHHKKRNGLMLIHRLAAAQGRLPADINIGEAPRRRQTFLSLDLMGWAWVYFLPIFVCVHFSGVNTSLSEIEATQHFMA